MSTKIPILFACSGCSNAGQLANDVAKELDRRGVAEMSCLAGVGAAKPQFLRKLGERQVWIIDGCPIECSLGVFGQAREQVDIHIRLSEFGVKKNASPPELTEFNELIDSILVWVAQQRTSSQPSSSSRASGKKASTEDYR